ncbi:MAG: hypothetical protein KF757_01205 [Phycisphaeraceae bacterium]|nr:hypothetical protein [Phycisphaeraceae bacterium]MCW5761826.1 hypothetical protein [Phycisphaeraceae bacterium]
MRDFDDDADGDLDPLGPSEDDLERFGDAFVLCASCGKAMFDQATVCPYCGFIAPGTSRTPWWVIIAALVALVAMFMLVF